MLIVELPQLRKCTLERISAFEVGVEEHRFAANLEAWKASQELPEDDAQLHLPEAEAEAVVRPDAEARRLALHAQPLHPGPISFLRVHGGAYELPMGRRCVNVRCCPARKSGKDCVR